MKCKKCGKEMKIDTTIILTSIPPRYTAICECGNVEYPLCSEIRKDLWQTNSILGLTTNLNGLKSR